MRHMLLAVATAVGISLIGIAGASAVPANNQAISQITDHSSQVIKVMEGCGRGWHRGPYGHCRRN
jgi:hypothetical protein